VFNDVRDEPAMPVARRLVLVRHAKSDWPPDVPDHQRPLGERGRAEAPLAGRWLAAAGLVPDLVLVSTATRTRQTWALLAAELSGHGQVLEREDVYHASTGGMLDVLREVPDDVGTALVVGHNPATESLAATLDDGRGHEQDRRRMMGKFPTCGIAVLHVEVASWAALDPQTCRLVGFAVPR
jgi:phosphohistidine phosphatase